MEKQLMMVKPYFISAYTIIFCYLNQIILHSLTLLMFQKHLLHHTDLEQGPSVTVEQRDSIHTIYLSSN